MDTIYAQKVLKMPSVPPAILNRLNILASPGLVQAVSSFYEINGDLPPSQFLKRGFEILCHDEASAGAKQQQRGATLELLFSMLLIREGIMPFYTQAEIIFVPNARFDVLLYSERSGVITISLKTSLRERWKQADLEAFAVRQVHHKSIGILASLPMDDRNEAEVSNLESKVSEGNTHGLKMVVNLSEQHDVELLLKTLRDARPTKAPNQLGPLLPSAKEIC